MTEASLYHIMLMHF